MDSSVKITGNLQITVKDKTGNIKQTQDIKNLVVALGKDYIARRMFFSGNPTGTGNANVMSHMAVGTDSTAAATSQFKLEAENARIAFTSNTITDNTITYNATFGAGVGTGTLKEAGIFNGNTQANSEHMLCRTVFADVVKASGDSIDIVWNVTVN